MFPEENRFYYVDELLAIIADAEYVDMEDHLAIFKIARDVVEKSEKEKQRKKERHQRNQRFLDQ